MEHTQLLPQRHQLHIPAPASHRGMLPLTNHFVAFAHS